MIYILQEFYNERWWHISFFTQRLYADENLAYLSKHRPGSYRIKEWQVPEDVE